MVICIYSSINYSIWLYNVIKSYIYIYISGYDIMISHCIWDKTTIWDDCKHAKWDDPPFVTGIRSGEITFMCRVVKNSPFIQWEFQDPKMEVLYHIRPYFEGISPYIGLKNRPYIW